MAVTATLKFVLREIPASREHDGLVYLALHNVPKGVPARVHLDEAPLLVACPSKLWRTALQRTQALAASGPPLWIVEAHVGVQEGALLAVVKGIQVLAGKPPAPRAALSRAARGEEAVCPGPCGSWATRRRTRPPPLQGFCDQCLSEAGRGCPRRAVCRDDVAGERAAVAPGCFSAPIGRSKARPRAPSVPSPAVSSFWRGEYT